MKITVKLRNVYASPAGTHDAGKVIEVDINEARQLVAGGYAVPEGLTAKAALATSAALTRAPETATVKPAETRRAEPGGKGAPKADAKPKDTKKAAAKPKIEPPKP